MEVENKSGKEVKVESGGKLRPLDLVLRVVALVLTLAAAVLLGVDKQTKLVPLQILPSLPPVTVAVSAEWHYLSAFV